MQLYMDKLSCKIVNIIGNQVEEDHSRPCCVQARVERFNAYGARRSKHAHAGIIWPSLSVGHAKSMGLDIVVAHKSIPYADQ